MELRSLRTGTSSVSQTDNLSSQANGSNLIFTTSFSYISGSIKVYLNGLRQEIGILKDYIENSNNQITFILAPEADDKIIVDYLRG